MITRIIGNVPRQTKLNFHPIVNAMMNPAQDMDMAMMMVAAFSPVAT